MTQSTFSVIQPITAQQFTQYHQLRFNELRQPWGQPKGSEIDELEDNAVHRMIIDENATVVAVARLHKTSCINAQIRFMAVDKNKQGHGLGKMLLLALEHEAVLQGVKTIELNAREVALRFYQACGYELLQPAHTLYGEVKHFAMKKHLTPLKGEQSVWLQELKDVWYQTIPMSKHMLIAPTSFEHNRLVVCADRSANLNLHNTMFAGSIYTLATLTGWGWVHLLLKQQAIAGDIVLADADIRYQAPLHGQPLAMTELAQTSGSISPISRGRKAKIQVQVNVHDGDQVVATFNGKYIVMPKSDNYG